jgi:FtsP/CotA-like multicopper oxidase with cupredoxin domain
MTQWAFFIIQNEFFASHPIHLHGHDFYVLGSEASATFSSSTVLNWENPPRRDVSMLPANGYLALAFQTNNPGAWLMHCHIAFHVGEGFGMQFVERASEIPGLMDLSHLEEECQAWDAWYATTINPQADSGLRKF